MGPAGGQGGAGPGEGPRQVLENPGKRGGPPPYIGAVSWYIACSLAFAMAKPGKKKTAPPPSEEIARLRAEIDDVDSKVLGLLDRRAELATRIGDEKRRLQAAGGPGRAFTFYDPEREQRIFERLSAAGGGSRESSFPRTAVPFVFREIISACRSLEASMKIAFLGPEGTYSQMAASLSFGSSVEYVDRPTI